MAKSIDHKFYGSTRWRIVSEHYRREVSGLCERCKANGIYTPAELVHHKVRMNPLTAKDPALAYGFGNLEALCRECHEKEHEQDKHKPTRKSWKQPKDGRRFSFDANGNLTI